MAKGKNLLLGGRPVRIGKNFKKAAVLIPQRVQGKRLVLVVDQGKEDDFIRERDMASMFLYGAFVAQSLALRDLTVRLTSESAVLVKKLLDLTDDARREICGVFAVQETHEVVRHAKLLIGAMEHFRSKNKSVSRNSLGFLREVDESFIALCRSARRMQHFVTMASPIKPEKIQVGSLFNSVIRQYERDTTSSRIRINPICVPSTLVVRADRGKLQTIVENLVDNAIRALKNKRGKRLIEIAVCIENKDVVISCTDNGLGVPVENMKRVWLPHESFTEGSGLGLALVRRLSVEHGGFADLDEKYSGGARFVVRIPSK